MVMLLCRLFARDRTCQGASVKLSERQEIYSVVRKNAGRRISLSPANDTNIHEFLWFSVFLYDESQNERSPKKHLKFFSPRRHESAGENPTGVLRAGCTVPKNNRAPGCGVWVKKYHCYDCEKDPFWFKNPMKKPRRGFFVWFLY